MQYNYERLNDNHEMSAPTMGDGGTTTTSAPQKKTGVLQEMRTPDKP